MALTVIVSRVAEVLLDDGWHQCDYIDLANDETPTSSFELDSYEYMDDGEEPVKGGAASKSIGFRFRENKVTICGPLSSIKAVKLKGK